ncbi:hypothetical protein [Thioclava sp.]|uniref:winged helix domain-containing protein n=1 Tax=Thioclava sp. TaxID=1933450 RepID=UPI003242CABA
MTIGINHRGATQYWVSDPSNEVSFGFTLRHSRMRDVLDALIQNSATGCNFYDTPAPRWASSIHRLRKIGLDIETVREKHGGDYPGYHARYVLHSRVMCCPKGDPQ